MDAAVESDDGRRALVGGQVDGAGTQFGPEPQGAGRFAALLTRGARVLFHQHPDLDEGLDYRTYGCPADCQTSGELGPRQGTGSVQQLQHA